MDMPSALLARLKADATLVTLTGGRIFWEQRPQTGDNSALPAIVLGAISEERPQNLEDFEDMATSRVQCSCFALTFKETRQMAKALIAAAVPAVAVTDLTGDDILFWRASIEGPRDLGEQTDTGFIYQAAVDVIVRWAAAA